MEITRPVYFDRFRCIAGLCPDSCCKEWDVQVDEESAAYYRSLPGDLGDRLRSVLSDTKDGTVMVNENGRCPMWRSDGLCRIQSELGEGALCHVCSQFPRLYHNYGDFAEEGLELSCPEAARLILDDASGQLAIHEVSGGEETDYDAETMDILRRSRETAFAIINDHTHPVNEVLILLLIYGYHVQAELDGGDPIPFISDSALAEAAGLMQPGDISEMLDFYSGLEILTPEWAEMLRHPAPVPQWPEQLRALARYFVLRYWLQAVSDFDLVCRVKFIIASCLTVQALGGDIYHTAQQ